MLHNHKHQSSFEDGHSYDKHAGALFGSLYKMVSNDVLKAEPAHGAAVLDAGCGPGRILRLIAGKRTDLDLHGVDLAQGMITEAEAAAERAGLAGRMSFTRADLADLPYADDSFDLVISNASMHHWERVEPIVPELARVLRPGGEIRIYDVRGVDPEPFLTASAEAFPGAEIDRTLLRFGWLPIRLMQLLRVRTVGTAAEAGH
ncbi:class I SAM-dependent methyltransferase [Flindersiella endophytica]